jgi:hypothetical protein
MTTSPDSGRIIPPGSSLTPLFVHPGAGIGVRIRVAVANKAQERQVRSMPIAPRSGRTVQVAGIKTLFGIDPKQDYRDKVAKVRLR